MAIGGGNLTNPRPHQEPVEERSFEPFQERSDSDSFFLKKKKKKKKEKKGKTGMI